MEFFLSFASSKFTFFFISLCNYVFQIDEVCLSFIIASMCSLLFFIIIAIFKWHDCYKKHTFRCKRMPLDDQNGLHSRITNAL